MLPNILAMYTYTSQKILSLSLSLFSFQINIYSEKKLGIYVHLDDDVFPNCIINKGILQVEICLIWLLGLLPFFLNVSFDYIMFAKGYDLCLQM